VIADLDGDGKGDLIIITTGFDETMPLKYAVYDLHGKGVLNDGSFDKDIELNVSDLAPGMYVLRVEQSTQVYTTKFVKL